MKSILFVTASLGYGIGGSEKALIEMLKCMDLSKYKITVQTLTEQPEQPFEFKGIDVIYGHPELMHMSVPLRHALMHSGNFSFRQIAAKVKVTAITKSKKQDNSGVIWDLYKDFIPIYSKTYDVVVGYGLGFATYFAIDKVKAKKKVLWMDNDLGKSGMNLVYCKKYYEAADATAVVDYSQIQRLCEIYPKLQGRVYAIRNIIPFEEIIKKSKEEKGFEDTFDGIRILSVGRLSPPKKFSLAVDASEILKDSGYKFRWYIIGFGPEREMLEQQIRIKSLEDYVILLGQKNNPYPFFSQTDLYVQTSIYEGSCITIEEAMVFGKPVVTTNFPPAYNKIVEGENGYIVEMDGNAIANGIKKLLDNERTREHMSRYQMEHPLRYDEIMTAFDRMMESM